MISYILMICFRLCELSSQVFLFFVRLVKLLEDIMDGSRILIFMDTKKGCDQTTRQLRMDGWPALSIHGDKSQAERDWVLSEFKAGKSPIMTATDVAARGLGDLLSSSESLQSVVKNYCWLFFKLFL